MSLKGAWRGHASVREVSPPMYHGFFFKFLGSTSLVDCDVVVDSGLGRLLGQELQKMLCALWIRMMEASYFVVPHNTCT